MQLNFPSGRASAVQPAGYGGGRERDLEAQAEQSERLLDRHLDDPGETVPLVVSDGGETARQRGELFSDALDSHEAVDDYVLDYGKDSALELLDVFQDFMSFSDIRATPELAQAALGGIAVGTLAGVVLGTSAVSCFGVIAYRTYRFITGKAMLRKRQQECLEKPANRDYLRKAAEFDPAFRSVAEQALLESEEEAALKDNAVQNAAVSIGVMLLEDLPSLSFSFILVFTHLTSIYSVQFGNLVTTLIIFLIKLWSTVVELRRARGKAGAAAERGLDDLKKCGDFRSAVRVWAVLPIPLRKQITKGRQLVQIPIEKREQWLKESELYRTFKGDFYPLVDFEGPALVSFGEAIANSLGTPLSREPPQAGEVLRGVLGLDEWTSVLSPSSPVLKLQDVIFSLITSPPPTNLVAAFKDSVKIVELGNFVCEGGDARRTLGVFLSLVQHCELRLVLKADSTDSERQTAITQLSDAFKAGTARQLRVCILSGNAMGEKEGQILADALDSGWLAALETLDLSNNKIGQGAARKVCEALERGKAPKLKHLNLSGNSLGDVGAESLVKCLEKGGLPDLETLKVVPNNIGHTGMLRLYEVALKDCASKLHRTDLVEGLLSEKGIDVVVGALESGRLAGIEKLEFLPGSVTQRGVHKVLSTMRKANTPRLKALSFSGSPIGDEGAEAVGGIVDSGLFSGLESLDLSKCLIGPEGAQKVCEALERGKAPKLKHLNLSGNSLGDVEAESLGRRGGCRIWRPSRSSPTTSGMRACSG